MRKIILILIVVVLLGGCGTLEFIKCGDAGYCSEGNKYGCNGSKACLAVKKEKCLKRGRVWNEEYGFCEYFSGDVILNPSLVK